MAIGGVTYHILRYSGTNDLTFAFNSPAARDIFAARLAEVDPNLKGIAIDRGDPRYTFEYSFQNLNIEETEYSRDARDSNTLIELSNEVAEEIVAIFAGDYNISIDLNNSARISISNYLLGQTRETHKATALDFLLAMNKTKHMLQIRSRSSEQEISNYIINTLIPLARIDCERKDQFNRPREWGNINTAMMMLEFLCKTRGVDQYAREFYEQVVRLGEYKVPGSYKEPRDLDKVAAAKRLIFDTLIKHNELTKAQDFLKTHVGGFTYSRLAEELRSKLQALEITNELNIIRQKNPANRDEQLVALFARALQIDNKKLNIEIFAEYLGEQLEVLNTIFDGVNFDVLKELPVQKLTEYLNKLRQSPSQQQAQKLPIKIEVQSKKLDELYKLKLSFPIEKSRDDFIQRVWKADPNSIRTIEITGRVLYIRAQLKPSDYYKCPIAVQFEDRNAMTEFMKVLDLDKEKHNLEINTDSLTIDFKGDEFLINHEVEYPRTTPLTLWVDPSALEAMPKPQPSVMTRQDQKTKPFTPLSSRSAPPRPSGPPPSSEPVRKLPPTPTDPKAADSAGKKPISRPEKR